MVIAKIEVRVAWRQQILQKGRESLIIPNGQRATGFMKLASTRAGIGLIMAAWLAGCASAPPNEEKEYSQIYDKPLLSSGAQFSALPPAVQNTVRAEAGSAEIVKVRKANNAGKMVYQIQFLNRDLLPPLYVAADGSLLDPNLAVLIEAAPERTSAVTGEPAGGITLNDLPSAVVKSIQRHAPDAEVDSIVKQVHGDKTTYLINFKDHMHPALHVGTDGTVLDTP